MTLTNINNPNRPATSSKLEIDRLKIIAMLRQYLDKSFRQWTVEDISWLEEAANNIENHGFLTVAI
jgi:hypothetical protein